MFLLADLSSLVCWHWQLWLGIPFLLPPLPHLPSSLKARLFTSFLLHTGEICDCKGLSTSPPMSLPTTLGWVVWMGSAPTFLGSCEALRSLNGCLPLILSHTAWKFMLLSLMSAWTMLQVCLCLPSLTLTHWLEFWIELPCHFTLAWQPGLLPEVLVNLLCSSCSGTVEFADSQLPALLFIWSSLPLLLPNSHTGQIEKSSDWEKKWVIKGKRIGR